MAYNVLKGAVEGSVDQYCDQEIDGVKVFKNTVSASVFYDTDAQSPCATMKDVAIKQIKGASKDSLLVYDKETGARTHHNLTFYDGCLATKNVRAEKFIGSAEKMTNLPAYQLEGPIKAKQIDIGPGLHDVRGCLQVKATEGIIVNNDGIGIALNNKSALSVKDKKLTVDMSVAPNITSGGQNLSDQDLLLVSDVSRNATHNTTLANLYDNYLKMKVPHASGALHEVQLKGKMEFDSSPKLSYNTEKDVLKVTGQVKAEQVEVENTLICHGAVVKNIKTITAKNYEVEDSDYTLICDSLDTPISVVLPPACNHTGRILIIKKVNTKKYSIKSHFVTISVQEGTIDINDKEVLKMNYSSRTVQSDGTNWWVIGSRGT